MCVCVNVVRIYLYMCHGVFMVWMWDVMFVLFYILLWAYPYPPPPPPPSGVPLTIPSPPRCTHNYPLPHPPTEGIKLASSPSQQWPLDPSGILIFSTAEYEGTIEPGSGPWTPLGSLSSPLQNMRAPLNPAAATD